MSECRTLGFSVQERLKGYDSAEGSGDGKGLEGKGKY